jgi:hypothetical protein
MVSMRAEQLTASMSCSALVGYAMKALVPSAAVLLNLAAQALPCTADTQLPANKLLGNQQLKSGSTSDGNKHIVQRHERNMRLYRFAAHSTTRL